MNPNNAIDIDFLRNVIDNDREFEKELFAIFTENAQRNISKMEEAVKKSDNNGWYMASHAFKGAAASIGAFELSKTLEHAQRHPEDSAADKNTVLQKVKEQFKLVQDFIQEEMAGK
jgi:HPt (histidine-containing phosphotransfer) domain-containing protein